MSEIRDPAIKLFGKTIGVTQDISCCVNPHDHLKTSPSSAASHDDKIVSEGEPTLSKQENEHTDLTADSLAEPETSSGLSDDSKIHDTDKEMLSPKSIKKEDPNEEKALKKPDKILPCPRCNSVETKFCYYNNYNVSQPRYFCKNCQRYWTAGGTMRNVPVGSGRRKNKSSPSFHYHHLKVSDSLQAARAEAANGMHPPSLRPNGNVLTFGSDKPLCDSMVSVLNLAEKSQNATANGFHGGEQRPPASCGGRKIGNDQSNGPCSSASSFTEGENISHPHDLTWKSFQDFPPPIPYFPGPSWPCSWNAAQWSSMVPSHTLNPSGYPVSFFPAPSYWLNVPWLSPTLPSSDQSIYNNTIPTSPTLGKHSRDGSVLNPSESGRGDTLQEREGNSVLVPKTLRIDDPKEAAKSTIWSTLGIKNEKIDSLHGATLFKAFSPKADHRNPEVDTSLVLQANPAAFSRSLHFRESTQ